MHVLRRSIPCPFCDAKVRDNGDGTLLGPLCPLCHGFRWVRAPARAVGMAYRDSLFSAQLYAYRCHCDATFRAWRAATKFGVCSPEYTAAQDAHYDAIASFGNIYA